MCVSKLFVAMSLLSCICKPAPGPAAAALDQARSRVRGWRNKVEVDGAHCQIRSRSPRGRSAGLKALLLVWAKGECSAVAIWRLCHAIVNVDRSYCGFAMNRIAGLASSTSGSQKNCARKLIDLLAEAALPLSLIHI